ncbi:hypothetical protein CA13_08790 [Planctomycetes bacterium CA13]|uniref:Uncharacterized protein n=1 Tax=Novipirellula herctigrandis TaxID=2527986 RepID=A0A5C5YWQ9_9BACT|nr:hypothetical protein CA13_08790 [Planctomycetes bacterium CA13]
MFDATSVSSLQQNRHPQKNLTSNRPPSKPPQLYLEEEAKHLLPTEPLARIIHGRCFAG